MAKIKPIDAKEIKVDGLGKVRPEAYSRNSRITDP